MTPQEYFVYILGNRSGRSLYTGVTSDLVRRVYEHKHKLVPGFTAQYNVDQLLYYESFRYINDAIAREKEIKGWRREKKLALVWRFNPEADDLTETVLGDEPQTSESEVPR